MHLYNTAFKSTVVHIMSCWQKRQHRPHCKDDNQTQRGEAGGWSAEIPQLAQALSAAMPRCLEGHVGIYFEPIREEEGECSEDLFFHGMSFYQLPRKKGGGQITNKAPGQTSL